MTLNQFIFVGLATAWTLGGVLGMVEAARYFGKDATSEDKTTTHP